MHGEHHSAKIMRAYWTWIRQHTRRKVWEQNHAIPTHETAPHLLVRKIQDALDTLGVTLRPVYRSSSMVKHEPTHISASEMPASWQRLVAATDGGLHEGNATVGAVACKLSNSVYNQTGDTVWEWLGRLEEPKQEVYLAESEAVEMLLYAMPKNSSADIYMDALSRMQLIQKWPHLSERKRIKVAGRASLRRIEETIRNRGKHSGTNARQN